MSEIPTRGKGLMSESLGGEMIFTVKFNVRRQSCSGVWPERFVRIPVLGTIVLVRSPGVAPLPLGRHIDWCIIHAKFTVLVLH